MTGAVTSPSFVGRGPELAALVDALAHCKSGTTRTAIIEAPAGGGKSRLADELQVRALQGGAAVLVGSCVELGAGSLPHAAVIDVLQGLRRQLGTSELIEAAGHWTPQLARLLPELGVAQTTAATPATGHAELLNAVRDVLYAASAMQPLVVLFEDVHWADAATRDLLTYLVRTLRDARLLIMATVRTEAMYGEHPLRGVLAELGRHPAALHLRLSGLSRPEVAEQVLAIRGHDPSPALLDRLVERSGGNPFFVEELLAAGGEAETLPPSVRDALLAHVARLPATAQQLVEVAAVIGQRFDDRLLAALVDVERLDRSLLQALDHNILTYDAATDAYRFRHALLEQAVYERLPPVTRRRLHERIAEVLAGRSTGAGGNLVRTLSERAHHLHAAGDHEAALRMSWQAGQAAEQVFAFTEAAGLYARVLELWDDVPPEARSDIDRAALLERAAESTWFGHGDANRASELLREALELVPDRPPSPRRAAMLSRLAGFTYETAASAGDGLPLHEEAICQLGDDHGPLRARLLGRYARALLINSRLDDAERQASLALPIALEHGCVVEELDARITILSCHGLRGDTERAMRGIGEARLIVGGVADPDLVMRFYNNASVLTFNVGRYADATRTAEEGDAVLRRLGLSDDERTIIACAAATSLAALGRLHEARSRLVDKHPAMTVARIDVAIERANILRMLGELDEARSELEFAAVAGASEKDPPFLLLIHGHRADVEIWAGAHDRAWRESQRVLELLEDCADLMGGAIGLTAAARVLAEAPVAGDETRRWADEVVARMRSLAEPVASGMPVIEAYLLTVLAERSRLDGPAPGLWEAAVAAWERLQRPYDVAYAQLRWAEALTAADVDPRVVEDVRGRARRIAARIGASLLLEALDESPTSVASVPPEAAPAMADDEVVTLEPSGDYWQVQHGEATLMLRDSKGLRYLAQLIDSPTVEIHAVELVSETGPSPTVARPPGDGMLLERGVGPALDTQAKVAYRRRVDDLREEIDDAERCNDVERGARAREEYEAILTELSRAVGLGGRDRPVRSPAEQARINVTKAIRAAIRRLAEHDATLAASLNSSVRTGTFCCYQPIADVPRWQLLR